MATIKVMDVTGTSRDTFSDTYRDAIKRAKPMVGEIVGVEVAPPFYVVITEDREIEFRSSIRILHETSD